jgi:sugar phosphate isomerase/epimerase
MKFAIVLSTNTTNFNAVAFQGNFEENVGRIAEIGYGGVELAIRDPALIDISAVQRTLARHNLTVPAIGTGQAWGEDKLSFTDPDEAVRRQAVGRIQAQIRLAAEFQAVVILGLIRGTVGPGANFVSAMGWLVEALRECAETAVKYQVQLTLEPISRSETNLVNTIEDGLALLAQVGADDSILGLLPDTYHINIEEVNIQESLRKAGDHIFHFHVADSNRRYPGDNDLDFKPILTLLRDELNYQGWVSAETLPYPNAETAAEMGLAHLRACIKE